MERLRSLSLILLGFSFFLVLANSLSVNSNVLTQNIGKCNKTAYQIFETSSCILCPLNAFLSNCPTGTQKITTGMGLRKCILSSNIYGCVHLCRRKILRSVCCDGYWGRDCRPCPGLASGQPACFGNGKCSDLEGGNGTCQCNTNFEGFACELCSNKRTYGANCSRECTCKNGTCDSKVLGNGKCLRFTCKRGYYGDNCETFEKNCTKCHIFSHCDPTTRSCKCNPGYSGDGKFCKEIDACKSATCPNNTICTKTGPGLHKCVCRQGYTGDGVICSAIDPCQTANGNCPNNTQCNYLGPGKANCTCLPGYEKYSAIKGCSIINECNPSKDCLALNSECVMVAPGKKECRCKSGYLGNGTVCNGNIVQRINDLHNSGQFKFRHIKNIIKHHSDLTFTFTARGPYTVFLPTDGGLEKTFTRDQLRDIIADKRMVLDLILVHSVQAYFPTSLLNKNGNLTTLKGWDALVIDNSDLIYQLNNRSEKPKIIASDFIAWNGILHVIDAPAWKPDFNKYKSTTLKTVWQVIGERTELKTFRDFIQVADMIDELKTITLKEVTIIAPVNEAFNSLEKNDTEFLRSPKGKAKLQGIIRHHIFQKKIGIVDLGFQPPIKSLAAEFVSLRVSVEGAVILGGKSKLINNNIAASNAYLHFTDNVLIPSSVLPIVQRHCDSNTTYSPCRSCRLKFSNGNCPQNYIATTEIFRCLYRINYWIGSRAFIGCKTKCRPEVQKCCEGFYGQDCSPCPGPVGNACYGNGKCSDGVKGAGTGTGICTCNPNFNGTACELCKNQTMFGPQCNKQCSCFHGRCDHGRLGNGLCIPNSCKPGYSGKHCAIHMQSCSDATKIPCHIHGRCYLNGSQAICMCNNGYKKVGENCYEIDPCLRKDRGGCDKNAICTKTAPGQSSCTCSVGWTGDGKVCTPINYCVQGRCHENAKCTFLGPGQFNCECKIGYEGDGTTCREVNSCSKNNGNCSPLARCKKTGPGSNKCECNVGYLGDGYTCLASLAQVVKQRKELTIMSGYMVKYNLIRYLADDKNMTAFIPSDDAISQLDNETRKLFDVPINLVYFGGSNVVPAPYNYSKLRDKSINMLPTLFIDYNMTINHTESGEPLIGGKAKIIVPNITASNGILHIVDKVVFPHFVENSLGEQSLLQGLLENNFTEMYKFIKKFKLEKNVTNCKPCTIIVPTNEAFNEMNHVDYYNITATDILYHMTDHLVAPSTIVKGQQFTSLAGDFYRLSFQKITEVTVNGVAVKYVDHNSTWIIYKMKYFFKAVKNTCYKNWKIILKPRYCRPCRLTSRFCRPGFRYAGKEDCVYSAFGSAFYGCKTICEKEFKHPHCCKGFWGRKCYACPGRNNVPCSDNGECDDSRMGTGHCTCHQNFTGVACENCIAGHFGPKCDQRCECFGNATCDQKTGFCICPMDKKGVKCKETATYDNCATLKNGNLTFVKCDQHASCYNNGTENGTCRCDYSFTGNGTKCKRTDPCKSERPCSEHATCNFIERTDATNCSCKNNYKGDGYYCQGRNLCVERQVICHENAECLYLSPGRYACQCKAGYTGDGKRSCKPIDVCLEDNGGCSFNARCSLDKSSLNTTCTCGDGFTGDGINCVGNVLESIQNDPNLREFYSRLTKSPITAVLSPENHVSIIAPQNNAFTSSRRKRRSADVLTDIDLKHYAVSCVSLSEEDVKKSGQIFVTVAGSFWSITSSMVINNDVKILSVKTTAQSTILIVDRLLEVPDSKQDSSQNTSLVLAAQSKGYGTFVQLLKNASLLNIVSNIYYRPYTMFWPNDEAFSRLSEDIKEKLWSDKNYARIIVNYHVIQSTEITTNNILSYSGGISRRTREGSPLYISCKGHQGDLFINDRSKIIERDIKFMEGIAFGVSEVLLPPGVAGRCDEIKLENINGSCMACGDNGVCPPAAILEKVDKNSSCLYQGKYLGCLSRCIKRTTSKKCCKNFYGSDCLECPGGFRKPCNGKGVCAEGLSGNGSCSCVTPFVGTSCEYCNNPNPKCHVFVRKFCTSRKNPCSIFATCNVDREHICKCWEGYEGDGYYCREIDRCQENNGGCDKDAICRYTGPNRASCECRSGFVGDGSFCVALPSSHPCTINNGNCHAHAQCLSQAPHCRCREGFVGDGINCIGTATNVIYTTERISEFAKQFKKLSRGVEGHNLIRYLSSEKEYTVFAPINYGFTKDMDINDLKNHIVEGRLSFKPGMKQTFLSLASNNINIVVSDKNITTLNNIARVLFDYPTINGMVAVIDHILPYKKPPVKPTTPSSKPTPRRVTTTGKEGSVSVSSEKNDTGMVIGVTVGVIAVIILIIVLVCFLKKRSRSYNVKYNRNFENILLESEQPTEEYHDDDEYQHQTLQHPSTEGRTTIANPTYVGNDVDIQDDFLEMTETSSSVPLTKHDAISLKKKEKS